MSSQNVDPPQSSAKSAGKELFLENQVSCSSLSLFENVKHDPIQSVQYDKPWWQSNFFLKQRMQFGTWDGVFTCCLLHFLGVIPFLRTGWLLVSRNSNLKSLRFDRKSNIDSF
jgi:hypothetical protein